MFLLPRRRNPDRLCRPEHFYNMPLKIMARKYGFSCFNVEADGNCFFHAALHQLELQDVDDNIDYDSDYLRQMAAKHIAEYLPLYKDFIETPTDDYLAKIKENGYWVDNVMIQAFSRAMNVDLVIIRSDQQSPTIFKRPEPTRILYLGYDVGKHYQSLVKKPETMCGSSLTINLDVAVDDFETQVELMHSQGQMRNSCWGDNEIAPALRHRLYR